jgi:trafficking protein particle complex subunit 1
MTVHSIHIFDRKGKTLFTKRYVKDSQNTGAESPEDIEQLAEQRKLVFGMIYSLREITKMLAPPSDATAAAAGLHSVKTGGSVLHNYETASGLRFALYTTSGSTSSNDFKAIRAALHSVYHELWIQCVTRSPLYNPIKPNVQDTNFEQKLDAFFKAQPWYT